MTKPKSKTGTNKPPANKPPANKQETEKKEIPEQKDFMFNGKKCFWKRPVHLTGIGTVSGLVTEAQMKAFKSKAPKNLELEKWVSSKDLIKERIEKAKAKARKKLGLKD